MTIEWAAEFETGISEIDDDHRNLVGLVNLLETAVAEGRADLGPEIAMLRTYVSHHFAHEEALFTNAPGYPAEARAAHLAQHQAFGEEVQRMAASHRADPLSVDPQALHAFLRDWLVNHILKTDKEFAAALTRA